MCLVVFPPRRRYQCFKFSVYTSFDNGRVNERCQQANIPYGPYGRHFLNYSGISRRVLRIVSVIISVEIPRREKFRKISEIVSGGLLGRIFERIPDKIPLEFPGHVLGN